MTDHPTSDPSPVRVLLVDDHDLLAEPLAIALRLQGLHAEVAPLDSAAAVLAAAERLAADLVLLDLDLGGAIGDGAELVPGLMNAGCRVLVVTGSTTPHAAARAVELGAVGVVLKHRPFAELVATVVAAAHGESVLDLQQRRVMVQEARAARQHQAAVDRMFGRLSAREAQVLRLLADGLSVGEIAAAWVVSEATVRTQVRAVLTKLGVTSQLSAVALARRVGWLLTRR